MRKGGQRLEARGASKPADKGGAAKKARRRSPLKAFFITLLVIAGLGLTGFAAWKIYIAPPPVDSGTDNPAAPSMKPDDGDKENPSTPKPTSSGLKVRDGVYTMLLVGTFEDGNTDTIMVVTFDTKQKKVDVMSIPRDTTTTYDGAQCKINSIYSRGGKNEKGMLALEKEISTLVGFKPNNYAMLKMSGFKKLVDTIGGVEFDIPMRMYHYDGKNTIDLQKGMQTLNGDKALQLMRFRGYSSNNKAGVDHDDFGRMQMQQKFIMAVFKKMTSLGNLTKLNEYVQLASESIKPTDLELKNMLWFADKLLGIDPENIRFCTLTTKTSGQGYYENVISQDALKLINGTINPYDKPVTADRCEWPQHK